MKKTYVIFLVMTLFLTSCTTNYQHEDIFLYVKDKYRFDDFTVSEKRTEVKDEDGYTDYLWTVKVDGIEFTVIDNYYYGMEAVTNRLHDNYTDVMLKQYFNRVDMITHFSLNESTFDGIYKNNLVARFNSKEELLRLYNELSDFNSYLKNDGYTVPFSFSYRLEMQNPIRNNISGYIVDDGDTVGTVTEIKTSDREAMLNKYILTCIDYRFEDLLSELTEQEIMDTVKGCSERIALIRNDTVSFYDDLCANRYHYGISFGTLYEILKREGFDPEGDADHYTFTGTDNNVYEISYDFTNIDQKNDDTNHYYYLKNGSPIKMLGNFYTHFTEGQIAEMCGLKLYIGTPGSYESENSISEN